MKAWRDNSTRCSSGFHSSQSMYSRGNWSTGKMTPLAKYSGSIVMRMKDRRRARSWLSTAAKMPKAVLKKTSSRLTPIISSGWCGTT